MIDTAVGRCKELKNTDTMDTGEGRLLLADDYIAFVTDRAKKGPFASWKFPYAETKSFEVRRGPFGMWRLIIHVRPPYAGETFHIRLGSYAARNAAHILRAKGVSDAKA
jgi:hypothetical protein